MPPRQPNITLHWDPPRPSGVLHATAEHDGRSHPLKAAVCVQSNWPGDPGEPQWVAARNRWALREAELLINREAPPATAAHHNRT